MTELLLRKKMSIYKLELDDNEYNNKLDKIIDGNQIVEKVCKQVGFGVSKKSYRPRDDGKVKGTSPLHVFFEALYSPLY